MPEDDPDGRSEPTATDLKFVGPATAESLAAADLDPVALLEKRVSHADLVDAGVNPGVAAKIRREHSLAWTFDGGEDLDRRAEQVRGLDDDERAWVAASAGDWTAPQAADDGAETSTDGSGVAAEAESAWQERSRPTPVTELDGVGDERAETLARAGINSVRSMALAEADAVAESLDLDVDRVREWREQARGLV